MCSSDLTFGPAGGTPVTLIAATGSKYIIYTDGTTAFDVLADAGNIKAGGTLTGAGNVSFDTGTFTFNTSEGDYDARFAGDSETNLLYIDASTDRVGINTNAPGVDLDVVGTFRASGNTDIDGGTFTFNTSEADLDARFAGSGETNLIYLDAGNDRVGINTATPTADFTVEGEVIFNDDSADKDFRVEGLTDENMLVSDASADKIGIGVLAPADGKLEVNQNSATGAIACISLDQDDTDQEFIYFDGTSAADDSASISSSTASAGGKVGAVRVSINGTDRWVRFYDSPI